MTSPWSRIQELVANCRRCNYVDKPYITYRVYEDHVPQHVRVLVVSESPPPGTKNDFLYNTSSSDRLRRTLSKHFGVNEHELLELFKRKGIFWDMAVRCRPFSRKDLEIMYRNCHFITYEVLHLLKPHTIVLLGTIARKQFELLRTSTGMAINGRILQERHPLYVIRFEKSRVNEYFKKLRDWLGL